MPLGAQARSGAGDARPPECQHALGLGVRGGCALGNAAVCASALGNVCALRRDATHALPSANLPSRLPHRAGTHSGTRPRAEAQSPLRTPIAQERSALGSGLVSPASRRRATCPRAAECLCAPAQSNGTHPYSRTRPRGANALGTAATARRKRDARTPECRHALTPPMQGGTALGNAAAGRKRAAPTPRGRRGRCRRAPRARAPTRPSPGGTRGRTRTPRRSPTRPRRRG